MWNGMMAPVHPELVKHRFHPGTHHPDHLINHLRVVSVEPVEQEPPDFGIKRAELGEGEFLFLVVVEFTDSPIGENPYEFMYRSNEPEPLEEDIIVAAMEYFAPQPVA